MKVIFQSLRLLPWKQSLKNQVFKKYMVFFADLLALKVNIKQLNAIKMNRVLFMYTSLLSAAHNHTFCRIFVINVVAIATQSIVFIKN